MVSTAYSWRERRPKLEWPTERSVRESHEDHYSSVSVVPSSLCEGFATKSNAIAFRGSGLVVRITDRAVTHVKSRSQMLSGARFRRAKTNVLHRSRACEFSFLPLRARRWKITRCA